MIRSISARVNRRAIVARFKKIIRASEKEIVEIHRRMAASSSYCEYGAGGTTLLACETGIPRVVSIETSLPFCEEIVRRHNLCRYIETGRLTLRHSDIGETKEWGFPVEEPSQSQVERYLSWPAAIPDLDLALVDGRYRVAVAAAIYLASHAETIVMIHDYADRPHYHVVEAFLESVRIVDSLAIFQKRVGARREAARLMDEYSEVQN